MTEPGPESLHAAMVRMSRGDRAAFRPVFDGLWPLMVHVGLRTGLPLADAEDAAQRALVEVFARISDLDPERNGVAWASTVARYQALSVRRRHQRRGEVAMDPVELPSAVVAGPEERLAADQLRHQVRAAIAHLGPVDRRALEEVLAGGELTPGETARKQRYRAKLRLRAWWSRRHG